MPIESIRNRGILAILSILALLVAAPALADDGRPPAADREAPTESADRPVPVSKERLMALVEAQTESCPCGSSPPCTVTVHDVCGVCVSNSCAWWGWGPIYKADVIVEYDASCNQVSASPSPCWRICGSC